MFFDKAFLDSIKYFSHIVINYAKHLSEKYPKSFFNLFNLK